MAQTQNVGDASPRAGRSAPIGTASRYSAYVANVILRVEEHEDFVDHMVKQYQDMLRQNLADPSIGGPAPSGDDTLN